jgi:hypothetical protein
VGVLARRPPAGRPFAGEDLAAVELLATGAALATDRLRLLRLWTAKLEQADAAHSQLLRYADDLRTTFSAERRRAEELRTALDAVELAYSATVQALASAVEAKDAYTGGHLARVTAYGIEACRASAATWPPPPAWSTRSCSTTWARSASPTPSSTRPAP